MAHAWAQRRQRNAERSKERGLSLCCFGSLLRDSTSISHVISVIAHARPLRIRPRLRAVRRSGMDHVRVVRHRSWDERARGSCSGAALGCALFAGSLALLAWNESRSVREARAQLRMPAIQASSIKIVHEQAAQQQAT